MATSVSSEKPEIKKTENAPPTYHYSIQYNTITCSSRLSSVPLQSVI